ncbi:MAG: ribbon-helix-helix domain-containing protein [Candidatus Njordarchaeales archaeon]
MRTITLKIPEDLLRKLDDLVRRGVFSNRSIAIREAIKLLIARYEDTIKTLRTLWGDDEEDD